MAQRIIIPRLGQTMTEGIVAKWYKQDGDSVQVGEDIYELEYDKAVATIQAKKSGIIRLLCKEGDTVPLSETVAIILEPGEKLEDVNIKGMQGVASPARAEESRPAEPASDQGLAGESKKNSGAILATPMVRRLAKEMGINLEDVPATNPSAGISKEDLEAFAQTSKQSASVVHDCVSCNKCNDEKISPLARKIAKDMNVDISKIVPADGRRISKEDVLAVTNVAEASPKSEKRVKVSGMRKIIAQRMTKSYFTYPTVTLTSSADMSELLKMRELLNEKYIVKDVKVTVTDMLVAVVAKALRDNPIINTSLDENEIVYHEQINIGIAVALDNGLVVPVIRNSDQLKIEEIAVETKRLVALTKSGRASEADISGGTFTITNLGSFGIDAFNPIINYPESAILGVGRTVDTPAVINGEIKIAKKAVLSLTHDHRVIDGVPAAQFLQSIVRYIEKPYLLLID